MSYQISAFTDSLKRTPRGLFNPWFHHDREHDKSPESPAIRKRQLEAYLTERSNRARFLFIAEARGYEGGRRAGMVMTSQRILSGHKERGCGVPPAHVFQRMAPGITRRLDVNPYGMVAPTATIAWGTLSELGPVP